MTRKRHDILPNRRTRIASASPCIVVVAVVAVVGIVAAAIVAIGRCVSMYEQVTIVAVADVVGVCVCVCARGDAGVSRTGTRARRF